jgi:predicted nucleic acid-binding protein
LISSGALLAVASMWTLFSMPSDRSGSVHRLAIDASTAAKWQLSDEPEAEQARLMLRDDVAERVAFIAPSIWHYEVANIVNKAVGTQRLTEEEGDMAFQALQALDIEYVLFPTPSKRTN